MSEKPRETSRDRWDRLQTIFAAGVCDYSRPGIGQVPITATWQSYD